MFAFLMRCAVRTGVVLPALLVALAQPPVQAQDDCDFTCTCVGAVAGGFCGNCGVGGDPGRVRECVSRERATDPCAYADGPCPSCSGNDDPIAHGWLCVENAVGPSDCAGDCSGDNEVTVDEIVALTSLALGAGPVDPTCPAGDGNADGEITVDEILTAITSALEGCPLS